MVRSFRTCRMARPLSPATALPMSSISSRGGAEGVISPLVSGEDCFAKPESALDESHSSESEEEESELLESDVSGPLPLTSTSSGAESPVSTSDEPESSVSVSDDSEPYVSVSDGSESSVLVSDGSESPISGSEESELLDSDESESLLLSVELGENSEPPPGALTGLVPLVGQPALSGYSPQKPRMRLGPLSQARSARWMAAWACCSHGRLSVGGPSC